METIKKDATEKEMREANVPWPKTQAELIEYLTALEEHENDYGTAVYCMSMGALATFYYMSHVVGATGFQASCADLDFLQRSRRMEFGFRLLDYEKLLYPQHCNTRDFPDHHTLLKENSIRKMLKEQATILLRDRDQVSPVVKKHWEMLAALTIKEEATDG